MPVTVRGAWITGGLSLIGVVLLICFGRASQSTQAMKVENSPGSVNTMGQRGNNTINVVTAPIFKTVSDPIRQVVHDNLERVRNQFAPPFPMVTISADSGNQSRVKIADEMSDLLRAAGFEVKVLTSHIVSPARQPIKAIFRPKDRQLVEAMLMAFEPMLHATVGVQEVAGRPGDEIVILIEGEPRFTPEGIKVFG
ncbi:MAG: hypothetical protein HYZ91_06910 [Candidatus Omnitrophica bacterium]|nr:hypothetical protein [Candidatus Omnitrophota bacterium]